MYTTWQTVCSEHIIFVSTKSGGEYICFWLPAEIYALLCFPSCQWKFLSGWNRLKI